MMAKLSIRCLYKRYHLLNVSLDNRVSFSSTLSESRRLSSISVSYIASYIRSLASAVSEPRQFLVEDCAAHLVLSLPRRLDKRLDKRDASSFDICLVHSSQAYTDVAILCACCR